jgi:hypothetical protein
VTDPAIHVLSVIFGTIALIVLGRVFIAGRDRQRRDDEDNDS